MWRVLRLHYCPTFENMLFHGFDAVCILHGTATPHYKMVGPTWVPMCAFLAFRCGPSLYFAYFWASDVAPFYFLSNFPSDVPSDPPVLTMVPFLLFSFYYLTFYVLLFIILRLYLWLYSPGPFDCYVHYVHCVPLLIFGVLVRGPHTLLIFKRSIFTVMSLGRIFITK